MADYRNDPQGLVDDVIKPVLTGLGLDQQPQAPTELLLGTAIQESGMFQRVQQGGGPALGLFQMEPNTHDDIWNNFLKYRPALAAQVDAFLNGDPQASSTLQNNDHYAAAMTRVHYYRMGQIVAKDPIPTAGDIPGMAGYWKSYYNTPGGAGTPAQFVANWESHHGPVQ